MTAKEKIQYLLEHPNELLMKKPFTRGTQDLASAKAFDRGVYVGEKIVAELPSFVKETVSQDKFAFELDPNCHKVLFDENIPSITAKTSDGNYYEIEFRKMALPFQKRIMSKQVLHLCGNPTQFILNNESPTEQDQADFALFKKYWKRRNQDGMRAKMVVTQKSYGDAGLLYYTDRKGRIKSRLISYEDGYVICSHNDDNGDRLMESIYYRRDNIEYIDSYDDDFAYRHARRINSGDKNTDWQLISKERHGFPEIPLVTHRGEVAWNDVQTLIEVYEIIYNIFLVIQKRHGWGILYIKGQFSEKAKKIAGSVILNDTSLNKDGSAEFLAPPSPQGMIDTLKEIYDSIQIGSSTTFILPKDISTGGDISGVAIQITQSLDNEKALEGVIEWQNVISKMQRLFLFGLASELVNKGMDTTAITRFQNLDISANMKVWRPRSDSEYNQMLVTMQGAGILSKKTAIEKNTESTPDELIRVTEEAQVDPSEQVIETTNIEVE